MKQNKICMLLYGTYLFDARVRREAETLSAIPEYQVRVVTLKRGETPENYHLDGVDVIELNQGKYEGGYKYLFIYSYLEFLLRCFISCTKLFFQRKINIIHTHNMPNFIVFAGIIPMLFGAKSVLDIHDSIPETFVSKFNITSTIIIKILCLEEKISTKFANKIICVNHPQKQLLVERGVKEEKIIISMNVPDPRKFHRGKVDGGITCCNDKIFRMVYHGTIAERLGVDLVIKAVAAIKDRIPNIEFHIFGKTDGEVSELKKLCQALDLSDNVYFRGSLTLDDLSKELVKMDVGIIGNRKDIATELMLPVKMLEYISLRIPVIAPRLQTIEYYFNDDMICFYEPENIHAMGQAIYMLYNDKEKRRQYAISAEKMFELYGWEKHKFELINLYKKL